MGVNPSKWLSIDRPVDNVSWIDAYEFCSKLSSMTGYNFTLPTEAEWEYAARGGHKATVTKYSGSSNVNDVAWCSGHGGDGSHPVGRLYPNELGIYDMSGNVWEWCLDWYGEYSSSTQTDPKGPSTGTDRVFRGGSWGSLAKYCRVVNRGFYKPAVRSHNYGFRVVIH